MHSSKGDIATKKNLVPNFFTALGIDDDNKDLCLFKIVSVDPSTGMHISKANTFVDSGEWDSKEKNQISLITESHFNGRFGSTSISPLGIDIFFGKDYCTIASHCKDQVHILLQYWYIQARPKSMSGFFATPKLPSAELGGPVNRFFEALSKDSTRPTFPRLTLGQWKLLFNSWK